MYNNQLIISFIVATWVTPPPGPYSACRKWDGRASILANQSVTIYSSSVIAALAACNSKKLIIVKFLFIHYVPTSLHEYSIFFSSWIIRTHISSHINAKFELNPSSDFIQTGSLQIAEQILRAIFIVWYSGEHLQIFNQILSLCAKIKRPFLYWHLWILYTVYTNNYTYEKITRQRKAWHSLAVGAKFTLTYDPRDTKSIGFLPYSSITFMWSLKVIGHKL